MRLARTLKRGAGAKGLVVSALERLFRVEIHMGWVQMHRPEIFGKPVHLWMHGLMRGESAWTPWERELFGSFTASIESCPF